MFKEPDWTVKYLENNRCIIASDFCSITGNKDLLLRSVFSVGIKPRTIK